MTSANHPHHHGGAHDALLDQLEHELAWLISAPLGAQLVTPPIDALSNDPSNRNRPPPDHDRRLPPG